jgi:hypothetical protein
MLNQKEIEEIMDTMFTSREDYKKEMIESVLNRLFTYHKPNDNQIVYMQTIRSKVRDLAHYLTEVCPDNNELFFAVMRLDECVMLANASIVRGE